MRESGVIARTSLAFGADERTAGIAYARGACWTHDGGVYARRNASGRAAVYRQHFPFRAGGQRSFRAARAYAERRWLPADAGQRAGRTGRTHRKHAVRLDYVRAGHLCARGRHDRPRAATIFRIWMQRPCFPARLRKSASIPPWIRLLPARHSGARHRRRTALPRCAQVQETLQRYHELQDIIAILGMDESRTTTA
jgi:hypothetical protein